MKMIKLDQSDYVSPKQTSPPSRQSQHSSVNLVLQ